jgi:hypothetical protein
MIAPSIPFSQRELAYKAYWHVVCMGRGKNLLGVDMGEVWAARLATIVGAERAVERALAGPARVLYSEPDDAALERMRAYLETRRDELERR